MSNKKGKIDSSIWAGIVIAAAIAAGFFAVIFFDSTGQKGSGLPNDYIYDISQYTKIDPDLILYRPIDLIPTRLKSARAIDVQDDIYIAGDKTIAIFDKMGKSKKQIALNAEPTSLGVEDNGTIVVGLGNSVLILDSNGVEKAQWTVPKTNAVLTSIAMNADMIFAADAVNGHIYEYDWQGKLLRTIGQKGSDSETQRGFVIPSPYFDVAMAPDGLLRVVDPGRHLIVAFTVYGDREWSWGKATPTVEGFSGCCNPVNFAVLSEGLFVTAEKGLVRVKIYDPEGQFLGVVAGPEQLDWTQQQEVCNTPEQCQTKGFDVAVDNDGKIYILDTVKNVVRVFEKK